MNNPQPPDNRNNTNGVPELDRLLIQSFAKLDKTALGVAIGLIGGLLIFAATNILVVKGGEIIGPNLSLLSQYFIGYKVTLAGSFIGFAYGCGLGFICGWLIAFLYDLLIVVYLYLLKLKGNLSSISDYFEIDDIT